MAARIFPPAFEPSGNQYTRAEVARMEESGELSGRWELVEGQLVNKMGQNPPHAYVLRLVAAWLARVYGPERISNQSPIEVAVSDQERNEPQPDIAVIAEPGQEHLRRHPRGDELLLLVEVADSSVWFDLKIKAPLYARAGVPEYWVVNIPRRMIVTHRRPENGCYLQIEEIDAGESVSIGEAGMLVSELIPEASQ
jgi:Uma2 family endonuclease